MDQEVPIKGWGRINQNIKFVNKVLFWLLTMLNWEFYTLDRKAKKACKKWQMDNNTLEYHASNLWVGGNNYAIRIFDLTTEKIINFHGRLEKLEDRIAPNLLLQSSKWFSSFSSVQKIKLPHLDLKLPSYSTQIYITYSHSTPPWVNEERRKVKAWIKISESVLVSASDF